MDGCSKVQNEAGRWPRCIRSSVLSCYHYTILLLSLLTAIFYRVMARHVVSPDESQNGSLIHAHVTDNSKLFPNHHPPSPV